MSKTRKGIQKSESYKNKMKEITKHDLEYDGVIYRGYDDLKNQTGISYHLYNKYYVNGIDPKPYINNKTYGINGTGQRWYTNGVKEKRFFPYERPNGWKFGRCFR